MATLPVEIILTIISYVPDISDRFRLIRVCRRWRDVLLEIAYNRVNIWGPQFEPLTKLILANPRIGAAIRDLSLRWWDSYTHRGYMYDTLPDSVEELVEQISESEEEKSDWRQDLLGRNEEAWLALLLTLVPNLTVFSGHYCADAVRVTQVVARAARKEPPFDARPALQRLETLHITHDDRKTVYPSWLFLPFFHLPSLRDVNLSAVKEIEIGDRPDDAAVSSASGTSPVESLVLENACNGRNGMAEFITSCANLKQFKYQHDNMENWGQSYAHFQPRKFYRALLTQKHSLEVLHLSDTGGVSGVRGGDLSDDEDDYHPEAYNRWFGSLAEFSQLQDLRIRVQNLLNYPWLDEDEEGTIIFYGLDKDEEEHILLKDILPQSLRSLHVAGCWEEHCALLVPNLEGVLDHQEQFPNLERIEISSREYNLESFEKLFVRVQEMCDQAGVTFEIY
jgi:hypothetical protein